jgi:hypothetical protein
MFSCSVFSLSFMYVCITAVFYFLSTLHLPLSPLFSCFIWHPVPSSNKHLQKLIYTDSISGISVMFNGAGIAQWYSTRIQAGWWWVCIPAGAGNFSDHHCVQTVSGAQPGALSLGVKRPGCKADHSPPSSEKVKNVWSYTATSPIHLYGVVLS